MRIIAGTYEGGLCGWESKSGGGTDEESLPGQLQLELVYAFHAHSECLRSMAIMESAKGDILVTGGDDEVIRIYNLEKKREIGNLTKHTGKITSLAFFQHTHLLSGSEDKTICIWRTSDWNCIHILGGHKAAISDIAVHPSGKLALSVARDRSLRLWDLVKGRCAFVKRLEIDANRVIWGPEGERYALLFNTSVKVYGAKGEVVGTIEGGVKINSVAFLELDKLVCGCEDGSVMLANVDGSIIGTVRSAQNSRVREIAVIEGESAIVAVAHSNGVIELWSAIDLTEATSAKDTPHAGRTAMKTLQMGSDCRLTAFACSSQQLLKNFGPERKASLSATAEEEGKDGQRDAEKGHKLVKGHSENTDTISKKKHDVSTAEATRKYSKIVKQSLKKRKQGNQKTSKALKKSKDVGA